MEDFEGQPDQRLAEFVDTYFWFEKPLEDMATVLPNLLALPSGETWVSIEGRTVPEGLIYCAVHDPAVVRYSKSAGPLFAIRLLPGAFDRLFHKDPREAVGVTPLGEGESRIASLRDALVAAPYNAAAQFAAANRALLALLPTSRPPNLADRFVELLLAADIAEMSRVAEMLGCSLRTLERACAARFARTPKRIARGIRVGRTFLREEESGERPETMVDFPFADLAHYANDLRRLTGRNRTQHAQEGERERMREVTRLWSDGSIAEGPEAREWWEGNRAARVRRPAR